MTDQYSCTDQPAVRGIAGDVGGDVFAAQMIEPNPGAILRVGVANDEINIIIRQITLAHPLVGVPRIVQR